MDSGARSTLLQLLVHLFFIHHFSFFLYHFPMIEISEAAARHLRELAAEKGTEGLRLGVEKGGCAGLQYAMSLGAPREGDLLLERDGAVVSVDQESIPHLEGCTIDYTDELTGAGFRIVNPKAARSCGCGTSFEPAPGA
jgi:iron-sulfur cluster assembly accessory protein